MSKKQLIEQILTVCKANNVYVSGDLFFSLAFSTEKELKKIAKTLGVK